MAKQVELRIARRADATQIAAMSRAIIEVGLGWSWTPVRVVKQIHCTDSVVLVAGDEKRVLGFAIMHFGEEDANLNLLPVSPSHQRAGIGRQLVQWLEKSADIAGISTIYLELRASNLEAHSFYRSLGYWDVSLRPGYYSGREAAMRMARDLRSLRWSNINSDDKTVILPLRSLGLVFKKMMD